MRCAIVAPSPVPFVSGGAENLWAGLHDYINAHTSHQCEVVKLRAPERTLFEVIDSYRRFSELDLADFDVVISGKYPAWMSRHENHSCYMLHPLRGLYDTYRLTGLPLEVPCVDDRLHRLVQWLQGLADQEDRRGGIDAEVFGRLEQLRSAGYPDTLFAFPGPFARTVVHALDRVALSPGRMRRYAAISKTVRDRSDYFPSGQPVSVLHPPTSLAGLSAGSDDYLFTASRLDGPKRVRLLIEAMRHVRVDIPFLIAGTGPDEAELRALASTDHRIRFLGYVSDSELAQLYSDALAVLFVPYDEDYGLITVEAMLSAKPVLTTTDAGGPNELVRDGETGFSVAPDAVELARRIEFLCNHRSVAREMGRKARTVAQSISWSPVVPALLGEPRTLASPTRRRRKVVVATTFPVFPPRGGGQSRVFHLYRELAASCDIQIVSLAAARDAPLDGEIAPGVWETRIPKTEEHERREAEISRDVEWVPITDIALLRLYDSTPAYGAALGDAARSSDIVVLCHPYALHVLSAVAPGVPFWYEAQDVEADLKHAMLGASHAGAQLVADVRDAERRCWHEAALVFACSAEDLARLEELYGPREKANLEVPNGVCLAEVPFTSLELRDSLKQRIGIAGARTALFMGSWHGPNLEALECLAAFARALPEVAFLVVGSVGLPMKDRALPGNVGLMGVVEEDTKQLVLSIADVALNPMSSGSGTNLKMLDYFAAGVPVITTGFGARGLGCMNGRDVLVADIGDFAARIREFFAMPRHHHASIIAAARDLVVRRFDWATIARALQDVALARAGVAPRDDPRARIERHA